MGEAVVELEVGLAGLADDDLDTALGADAEAVADAHVFLVEQTCGQVLAEAAGLERVRPPWQLRVPCRVVPRAVLVQRLLAPAVRAVLLLVAGYARDADGHGARPRLLVDGRPDLARPHAAEDVFGRERGGDEVVIVLV